MRMRAQKIDKIMEVFALEFYRRHKCEGISATLSFAERLSFSQKLI